MSREPTSVPAAKYEELSVDPLMDINGKKFENKIAVGQVTIRLPLDYSPVNLTALLYGFLPWLIPITLVVYFVTTWHFIYIYGPLISVVLAGINEGILKKIFNQPRPPQSANTEKDKDGSIAKDESGKIIMKPGMPSGHVLNATSIMVWALLEVYFNGPGLEKNSGLTYTWLAVILAVHLPVPWARWHNLDHTFNQCLVSTVIGTLVGIGSFYLRAHYISGVWKPWLEQAGMHLAANHKPVVAFFTPPWITTTALPKEAAERLLTVLL